MILRITRCVAFCAVCSFIMCTGAIARGEVLILSSGSPTAQSIAARIADNLGYPSTISSSISFEPDLIIALGDRAFADATANSDSPLIGTFLTSTETILPERQKTYAIYSDPTAEAIAKELIHLFPNSKVGYIYTDLDKHLVSGVEKALIGSGTSLTAIQHTGNTFGDIRTAIDLGINAMLITPNRMVYKPENIRFVLESLFRKSVPVVSTMATLIPAGAVVAITADEDTLIQRTTEKARAVLKGEQTTSSQSIRVTQVTLKVNPGLSDYFGIKTTESKK